MKRVGLALFAIAVLSGLTAGVGLVASNDGRIAVARHEAAAVDLNKADDTICVVVPVFAGQNRGSCPIGQAEIKNNQAEGGAIVFYLKLVLKLLNGLVGGVIVLVLVIAGIQYISSAADPNLVKAAKTRIQQAITALVLYLMMFAILNFLVPGGILS